MLLLLHPVVPLFNYYVLLIDKFTLLPTTGNYEFCFFERTLSQNPEHLRAYLSPSNANAVFGSALTLYWYQTY